MKTKRFFLVLLVLSISFASCNKNDKETNEGKLKRETVSIAPKYAGRILKINVKEGDLVKAGDTLAELSFPEVEAKILQAEGAVLSASSQHLMAVRGATKEEREQVMAMYSVAVEQFNLAQKTFDRISDMYKDSFVTAQAYDEVVTKYNGARLQLEGATAKKNEIIGGIREEKIKMAEGTKGQAEGALKEAKVAYAERFIIAPKDMSIETIALKEGELALPGYNIFIGYDLHSAYFRFTATESKIIKFKRGENYDIFMPYANVTVKAKLIAVKELAKYAYRASAYPNYQMGEAVYELKLLPENETVIDSLFDNYTAILTY